MIAPETCDIMTAGSTGILIILAGGYCWSKYQIIRITKNFHVFSL